MSRDTAEVEDRKLAADRRDMVARQVRARGIRDPEVLRAMETVPREAFVAPDMVEFAYHDTPLPIDESQTISQPYIVAFMAEALELGPDDRVLEVGTGSGYAAAVLAEIAAEVFTVERHGSLAESARRRLEEQGYGKVRVLHGDGTLGWPDHAPYDAVVVAAGGPQVPPALLDQLAPAGRLVMPAGGDPLLQRLVRVRRRPDGLERETLADVRFVPLVGAQGWKDDEDRPGAAGRRGAGEGSYRSERGDGAAPGRRAEAPRRPTSVSLPDLIRQQAEPIPSIEAARLDGLLARIGDARLVLLGEATHGTAEFYDMRSRLTRALVERKGFDFVAVEADWPDAAQIDAVVRDRPRRGPGTPFTRFPTWMWANEEVRRFVHWLRSHNQALDDPRDAVGFFGLDLYSLHTSVAAVLDYLEEVDPETAETARERYGCLTPWEGDPAAYGRAALTGRYRGCADDVVENLTDLLRKRLDYAARDGDRFLDAVQNARLVANAERYYRVMYLDSRESWNLRDRHMFDTLEALLAHHGPGSKGVVWAHNSHLGDASATEMAARGELNVGELCRERFGSGCYGIGLGTHRGTVAAARRWGGPVEVRKVRPSQPHSYERLCHDVEVEAFLLPLRDPEDRRLRTALLEERLERAIGVVYRPETERVSHYFHASLPRQFDEWIWFDETRAVSPLGVPSDGEVPPDTFPFGL